MKYTFLYKNQSINKNERFKNILVPNNVLPRLLIFGNFSHPRPYLDPRLLIQENFCFSNCKIFKVYYKIFAVAETEIFLN